jgi:hypothetical protein
MKAIVFSAIALAFAFCAGAQQTPILCRDVRVFEAAESSGRSDACGYGCTQPWDSARREFA